MGRLPCFREPRCSEELCKLCWVHWTGMGQELRSVPRTLLQARNCACNHLPKNRKAGFCSILYNGGYRADFVAYTLAMLATVCSNRGQIFDFMAVWNRQDISPATTHAVEITAKFVYDDIMNPMGSISNISEWCKRDAYWQRLHAKTGELSELLPDNFIADMVTVDVVEDEVRYAAKTQRIRNGIEAQKAAFEIPAEKWEDILAQGEERQLYSQKEVGILRIAAQMPAQKSIRKQAFVLLDILDKAKLEAIYQD